MPKCLERKATESGKRRARSHRRCGAVVRRSRSRSTVISAVMWRSFARGSEEFYNPIELQVYRPACVRSGAAARPLPLAHALAHQPGELASDVRDVDVFLALPTWYCVAHTENGECGQPRVEIGAEFARADALLDNVLEDSLQTARPAADPPSALGREMLTLVEEHPDEVTAVNQRRQMRFDQ